MNLSVEFRAGAILTIVTGRSHDRNAGIDQSPHRPAYRIVSVRLDSRHTQAHANHADVVSRAIRHYPVKSGQDPRCRARANGIQNAKVDDLGARSDADEPAVCDRMVDGSHRSHVRAVTVRVIFSILAGEVAACHYSSFGGFIEEGFVRNVQTRAKQGGSHARGTRPAENIP